MHQSGLEYKPLEDGMIRLLTFLPGEALACTITHHPVDKAPTYAALSYTWGENIFDHTFSLDGSPFFITENLHDALTTMYQSVREEGMMFWVDAICINQKDIHERSSQVGLMSKIYQSAVKVLVWLGRSSPESDCAMEKMVEWTKRIQSHPLTGNTTYFDIITALTKKKEFYGPTGSEEHTVWLSILSLWERPWWRRAWIVQEATSLTIKQTIIHCGNRTAPMDCLRTILDIRYQLAQFTDHYLTASFDQGFAELLDNFKSNREVRPQSLLNVLQHLRTYECKDSRDKVYAVLGMASEVTEGSIVPDYLKPLHEVYVDVARLLLGDSTEANFNLLGHVLRPTDEWARLDLPDKEIPSWVPDWRGPKADVIPFKKVLDRDDVGQTPSYNASKGIKSCVQISGSTLYVRGLCIDNITSVNPICVDGQTVELRNEKAGIPEAPDTQYVTGGTVGQAYNHVLLADLGRKPGQYYSMTPFVRGQGVDWTLLESVPSTLSDSEQDRRVFLATDLKCTTFGRRVFYTSKGYMGIGPAAMKIGDSVSLFLGGQLLHVLRVDGQTQEYVGECYVHGLMDGGAINDKSVFETFNIH